MERLILSLLFFAVLTNPAAAQDDWFPIPLTTAAEVLSGGNDAVFLHPGSFGAGDFPFRANSPAIAPETEVDGIPLESYSPFGPNLERIPALFTDSLLTDRGGNIHISTIDSIPAVPVTRIGFLSGERRRFRFQGTFGRKINARSGIFVGGDADGIRGNTTIQGNEFRLYRLRYIRVLENGGIVTTTADGNRDRSDIYDLANGTTGGRTIDNLRYSAGIRGYQLAMRTMLSGAVYYRNGIARFDRSGADVTCDDNSFGATLRTDTSRERSAYSFAFSNETRAFDAGKGRPAWDATTTGVSGEGDWRFSRMLVSLGAGGKYSSEYGIGASGNATLTIPFAGTHSVVMRGSFAHRFPDPGTLFYPSLSYGDTLVASPLRRYWTAETEAGIEGTRGMLRYGMYGFTSLANAPGFTLTPAAMTMSGDTRYTGGRLKLELAGGDAVRYQGAARVEYTGSTRATAIWPRPALLAHAGGNFSRPFFNGNLDTALNLSSRLEHYTSGNISPDGTYFFLDTGVVLRVATFTLFYTVENLTGTNQRWFDAYETQGRNSFWGVRWNLFN